MNNFEKIEQLKKLKSIIEVKNEQICYVNKAEQLSFINYQDNRYKSTNDKSYITFEPSDNLLLAIKEVTIKILNEQVAELEKEIESIFSNTMAN
jgi:hypothetical protein